MIDESFQKTKYQSLVGDSIFRNPDRTECAGVWNGVGRIYFFNPPGLAFGKGGEGFVRIGLVENTQRIRQAAKNIKRYFNT